MAEIKKSNTSQLSKSINRTTPPPDISNFTKEDIQAIIEEQHIQQEELGFQVEELKRIQEELSESRDKYQQLYDTVPVGYLTIDKNYSILEANATSCKMLSAGLTVMLKAKLTNFISPTRKSQDIFYLHLQQLFKIDSLNECELEMQRSDGSRFTANLHTVTEGENGESGKIHIMIQDVTERNRIEEALKSSESLYRSVIENAKEAIIIAQDGKAKYFNLRLLEIIGHSAGEVKAKPFLDFIHPEDRNLIAERYRKRIAGEVVPASYDYRVVCRDGSTKWMNMNAALITVEGRPATLNIIDDITERKKNEEALIISEERFRTLIEESPIAICVSRKGKELFTNKSFKIMFGIPLNEDTTGQPVINHYAEECKEDTLKRIRRRADNLPVPNEFDAIGLKRDGSKFYTHLAVTEVKLLDGRAIVSFILDITERKQAREALDKIRDELEVKVRERTEQLQEAYDEILKSQKSLKEANKQLKFFGHKITQIQEEERKRIAYELHDDTAQYLGILKMQIGALADSEEIESPKVKEKLRFLEKDADRAFNDVRRYSHELRPSVLDHMGLKASLEQTAEDINKLNQFTLEIDIEGKEPKLSEEVKLGFFRIAQEALNNIRKHAKADKAVIYVAFRKKQISMKVIDDGIGFNTQKAKTRSGKQGSLGLLSMRERADLIGAKLKIASKPGTGTIVSVDLSLNV